MIRVTWRKSAIGYAEDMKLTVAAMGFKKLNQTRELPDNSAIRGMIRKVAFLVSVEGEPWDPPKRARYKIWRARSNKKHARGN